MTEAYSQMPLGGKFYGQLKETKRFYHNDNKDVWSNQYNAFKCKKCAELLSRVMAALFPGAEQMHYTKHKKQWA